ncbi:MAG: biotin--[acetyl-CoA-carboxylase] ligase, partial [Stellaceae bacterium]
MSGDLPPFFRLVASDTLVSTNDEARRLARAGASEGTLITARSQTAGRGRQGRIWVSQTGNLHASLVL